MNIVTIIGARPQFIKAVPVSRAIYEYNNKDGENRAPITEIIIHTGQHFDTNMSDVFFKELGIPNPDYNLGINSANHGAMTGRMLEKIEEREKGDARILGSGNFVSRMLHESNKEFETRTLNRPTLKAITNDISDLYYQRPLLHT